MSIHFPGDITSNTFLRDYWQQRPLLMRGALPGITAPISPEELAGLACEEEVESRIVLEHGRKDWELRHGPFAESDFTSLPESRWTLLVQDLDKLIPEAAAILKPFRFLPLWRLDDLMISYAADKGSVGPHVDTYDVFLIQVEGRRRWQINTAIDQRAPLRPNLDIRILKQFSAESEWVLEPGDILYLPPGVAHWGIAEGPCMTCSVGYRSPTHQEMVADWGNFVINNLDEFAHYTDPPLRPSESPGRIDEAGFQAGIAALSSILEDKTAMRRWYGCFVTQLKGHQEISAPEPPMPMSAFRKRLVAGHSLWRNPLARLAYARESAHSWWLFASGAAYLVTNAAMTLGALLSEVDEISPEDLVPFLDQPGAAELLYQLYCHGQLEFEQ